MKPSQLTTCSRRRFLQRTLTGAATAALAPYFVPAGVLAASGSPAPSDRVGIGYIGVGRRGNQLMRLPPAGRIVAVADLDRSRRKPRRRRGNAAPIPNTGNCWTPKTLMP